MERDPDPPEPSEGLKHTPLSGLRAWKGVAAHRTPPPLLPEEAAAPRERVTVRRQRAGQAGKTVTLAEGPGLAGSELDELAREAARALGAGARVENGRGTRALVVQGDQVERLAAWLEARGFRSVARGN